MQQQSFLEVFLTDSKTEPFLWLVTEQNPKAFLHRNQASRICDKISQFLVFNE